MAIKLKETPTGKLNIVISRDQAYIFKSLLEHSIAFAQDEMPKGSMNLLKAKWMVYLSVLHDIYKKHLVKLSIADHKVKLSIDKGQAALIWMFYLKGINDERITSEYYGLGGMMDAIHQKLS